MYYYLYKITNTTNGKIYVGVHRTENLDDGYMGSGVKLKQSQKKHGLENFTKDILQFFDSEEAMFEEEANIVNEEFIKDRNTYNLLKRGGYGGWGTSTEQMKLNGLRSNIGLEHKKRMETDQEYRERIRKSQSEAAKKRCADPNWSPPINFVNREQSAFKGKTHSEEARKKQSQNGSSVGKSWIYNLELKQSHMVPKDALDAWIAQGWIKGRKQKF